MMRKPKQTVRPFRSMHRASFAIITTLALVMLTACPHQRKSEKGATPLPEIRVIRAEPKDFSADITSFGSIVYTKKNDVTASVEGILASIPVREGDGVREGTRIALLKNVQLEIRRNQADAALISTQATTKLAEAEYEDARRNVESRFIGLERTDIELGISKRQLDKLKAEILDDEKLLAIGGITEEAMRTARSELANAEDEHAKLKKEGAISRIGLRDEDLALSGYAVPTNPDEKKKLLVDLNTRTKKAELDVARANEVASATELSSAEALIAELSIDSPIAGIVGALYKESGERVEAGDKIMTIFSADDAWVVFPVDESDAGRIRKGMAVSITVDSIQREPIKGTIDIVSPTVDPQSGNVTVKALVKRMGNRGKPGMFANVTVATGIPVKKTLLPLSCLALREDNTGAVMTVRNGRVFRRKVSLGVEYKGEIEITDGLAKGEEVVLEPTPLIKEGDEVEPYEK